MPHPLALFRFCPRCGSQRFVIADARAKRCDDCGFVYYHNASAATAAVIFDDEGRLLTVRRAFAPAAGTLDVPGGFGEPGETLEESCRREVREETGADITVGPLLFSIPNTYTYSGFDVHTTDAYFSCRPVPGAVFSAADDAAELRWLAPADICPDDFGLYSAHEAALRLRGLTDRRNTI